MGLIPGEINLLYIEDDVTNAQLIMDMLRIDKHTHFKVDHKSNLADGIKVLDIKGCRYDVVLLDLVLPNSEGISTYEKVRGLCEDIPIVIISGYEDIACKCVRRGAQDYILKTDITSGLIARSLKYAIERKRLEIEKLLAENQFKNVMNNTPLGAHMYELRDGELYFCGYNPAADKILDIDHSKLLGMKITEIFPSVGTIKDEYIKVIESGEPWRDMHIDYEDENVEGTFKVYAFKTGDNKMATTFEDISVKAKMEDELKKSEEKYRNLVEVARAVMYEIDFRTLKFTYVNDELCRLTGWTREELLAMSATDLLTPRSLKEFGDRLTSLKNGEYISATHEFEGFLKNGDIFWTLVTATYKEDADENVIGASVVAIDITEKKLAQFEAEHKEEIIFNDLEIKIQEWREELTLKSVATQVKLDKISLNINSMKIAEVY